MISFRHKGDFRDTTSWLQRVRRSNEREILEKFGKAGVEALSAATPVDTGRTASSWYYEIEINSTYSQITFCNSNIVNDWCNIALILQYGHGTGTGGWVEGRDYINPAIQPLFDKFADEAWEEVTRP